MQIEDLTTPPWVKEIAREKITGKIYTEEMDRIREALGNEVERIKSVDGKTDPAFSFLEEAGTVMKQRAALRDKPEGERSMASIVASFNTLTGHTLSEAEGWEFMILLKMVRGRQGSYNRDDYVDGAAYFGLLGECKSGEQV